MTTPQTSFNVGLASASGAFLDWLDAWVANLGPLDIASLMREQGIEPDNVAVISSDMVNGFCCEGPLSSPRIAAIMEPAADLFKHVYKLGVRQFALVQEYHTHDALEFEQFGAHCVRDTYEAETVEALASLPFSDLFTVIHKNSLHPALHTDLGKWLAERPRVNTFIAVGNCTDLCLYQLMMHLKLDANAVDKRVNVLVPANCAQTYDLPVEAGQKIGAMPHDGDLVHAVFLYHMALNGAMVVSKIE